jgi:hypothetical protein
MSETEKRYRDADTGEYVTEEYALANPKTTVSETFELSDQDVADLAQLDAEPAGEPGEVNYHPILQVWREILKPAYDELGARITPQWASRIVASYQSVQFYDMVEMRDRYYGKIIELLEILNEEIASDDDCLSYTTPEEDVAENGQHYKNLLRDWQLRFLQWELNWDCLDPAAGVELAAISEVHKAFFGETGLTQFLDNIRFEYTEADQAELSVELEALKAGQ